MFSNITAAPWTTIPLPAFS